MKREYPRDTLSIELLDKQRLETEDKDKQNDTAATEREIVVRPKAAHSSSTAAVYGRSGRRRIAKLAATQSSLKQKHRPNEHVQNRHETHRLVNGDMLDLITVETLASMWRPCAKGKRLRAPRYLLYCT